MVYICHFLCVVCVCFDDMCICLFAGLGSLYGDHELQDENMERQAVLRIIEKYLVPHFERLVYVHSSSIYPIN